MAMVLGMNGKLYRNTGSHGSPTWNLCDNVRDLTVTLETDVADVTTRNNNGYKAEAATLRTLQIEFEAVWDSSDTDIVAFRDAFLNNTSIEVLVLDGLVATTGSQGPRAICMVKSFSRAEQLTEAMKISISLIPTYNTSAGPSWYTV